MALYPTQNPPHSGLPALAMSTPVTGDQVQPGPYVALLVVIGATGAPTVSIPLPARDGQTVGPRTVTMAANNNYLIDIPSSVYGTGLLTLTWTGTLTNVTVAAITTSPN